VTRVAAVRDTVGNGVDLCVEIHRRMDPHHAAGLGRELAAFRPYFLEDPLLPDSVQNMAALQRDIEVPIATGERLHTIFEFNELLAARGCRFIRPDVCLCGGLTHSKKIAAIAEAYHVGVIPHNPLSPVSTAACVQLDACIPNFALQEYTGEDRPPKSEILIQPLQREGGYLIVPDRPGIGVDLNLEVARRYPPVAKEIRTPLHEDGSVADA
jgi:galactonate dehydratase